MFVNDNTILNGAKINLINSNNLLIKCGNSNAVNNSQFLYLFVNPLPS